MPQSAQAACRRFTLPVDMGYTCDLVVCGVSRNLGSHEIEARTIFARLVPDLSLPYLATTAWGGASPRQKARHRVARSPRLHERLYFRQCEFLRPIGQPVQGIPLNGGVGMVQIPGENVERGIVGHAEKAWQGVGQQFGRVAWCAVAERSEPFRPLPRFGGYHLDGRPLGTDPEFSLRDRKSTR